MNEFVQNFLNVEILHVTSSILARGLLTTVVLAAFIIPLGMLTGLLLASAFALLGAGKGARVARWPLFVWVDTFRAFPPLVLLIYIYYGGPMVGIDFGAYGSIALAFTLNSSSYFCEIFRAGIESVPRGQWDAARASSLSWPKTFVVVILPQATRTVLPDIVSNIVTVTQLTSLAGVIGILDLLRAALVSQGTTYNATPIIAAAILYLILLWPPVRFINRLERRLRGSAVRETIPFHP